MADLSGQIDQARKAGYSDADIVGFLKQKEPKVAKALDSGYQPQEVLAYLTRSTAPSAAKPPAGYRAVKPGEIPTESGFVAEPQQDVPRSFMQRVLSYGEVPIALASGAVSAVVDPFARLAGEVFGPGKLGSAEATRSGEAAARAVTRGLYQPQSPEAQGVLQTVGKAIEPLMAFGPAGPIAALGAPSGTLKPAVRAVKDIAAPKVQALAQPEIQAAAARATNRLRTQVAASQEMGPIIDATKDAADLGYAVNPALTNPTKSNKLRAALSGDKAFDFLALQKNAAKTTELIREDLGVAPGAALDKAAVDAALAKASAPYEPVRQLGQLQISDKVQSALQSLKNERPLGNAQSVAASNRLIDEVIQQLQEGRSGAEVLNAIRQQRVDANSLLSSATKTPETTQLAKTHKGIAKALERLIDENAPNEQVLKDMRAARERLAQIYEHESAIDFATGSVDPQIYTQIFNDRQGRMTGVGAKIAKVAGMFPSIMQKMEPTAAPAIGLRRAGVPAAGGALIGGQIAGYPGSIGGAATLGAIDSLRARAFARNMLTPGYQAANVMAPDWRSAAMFLPETPVVGSRIPPEPTRLLGYTPEFTAITPLGATAGGYQPNFTMPPSPEARAYVGPAGLLENAPPTKGWKNRPVPLLEEPSAESTMRTLATERARANAMASELAQEADLRAAAAEQAAKVSGQRTTGRAVDLQWDPATQSFKPVEPSAQGPSVITPAPQTELQSAIGKLTAQVKDYKAATTRREAQGFLLTAEEKIALDKARQAVNLIDERARGMSDEMIASRLATKEYTADLVAKAKARTTALARSEAALAEQLANRSNLEQLGRQKTFDLAAKQRELESIRRERVQLAKFLEDFDEKARAPRPLELGGQGPKTRAAQRNAMAPKSKNNLAP